MKTYIVKGRSYSDVNVALAAAERAAKSSHRPVALSERGYGLLHTVFPDGSVGQAWELSRDKRRLPNTGGSKLTKAQKRAKAQKASVQRRVAVALAKFLKQANPAMKTSGASIQRLKGGVLKITPIKANAGKLPPAHVRKREFAEENRKRKIMKMSPLSYKDFFYEWYVK